MNFPTILALHTEGVKYLTSNAYVNAMKVFRHCLVQLRDSVSEDSDRFASFHDPISLVTVDIDESCSPQGLGHNAIQVYRQAFAVQAKQPQCVAPTSRNVAALTVAALYNLALASQLRAAHSVEQQAREQRRAASLYGNILGYSSNARTDDISTVLIAAGNNLCCLYAEMLDFRALTTCVECTKEFAGRHSKMCSSMEVFFHNLVVARSMARQPAAAA